MAVYRIGSLAAMVKRKPNTIHKWEAQGIIAESMWREGSITSHRVYCRAEMVLIYKAMKAWYAEHYKTLKGVNKPDAFRFGQIYWDMRQYFETNPVDENDYILSVPPDYELPAKLSFRPSKEYCVEGQTYMEEIYRVNSLIRDSDGLARGMRKQKTRLQFLSRVYQSQTPEDMGNIISEYEEIVKHAESNARQKSSEEDPQ